MPLEPCLQPQYAADRDRGRWRRLKRGAFHVVTAAAFAGAIATVSREGHADPQASAGVTFGAALNDVVGPRSIVPAVHLGGRADVLFFRSNPRQMGLGPYVDLATGGFESIDTGGGASWLLPLAADWPVVLSGGAFVRNGAGRNWAPGVEGTLFAGSRSYNFHSWYGMAFGVFAQSRWVPSSPATVDLVLGLQLDAELLILPALLIVNGLK
jgi:hypothetical protein